MKLFFATDIHGSAYWAQKITEQFHLCNADKLVLLGDIYNHGPRNPFPRDYAPMKVAQILNALSDKIMAIVGNCDSEVDQMISEFPFVRDCVIPLGNRRIYCTHGHVYNKNNLPKLAVGDVLIYGHFHVNELVKTEGVYCVNVSSVALPKDCATYCIADEKGIEVFNFDGETVLSQKF